MIYEMFRAIALAMYKIRCWLASRRYKRNLMKIRATLAFFGHDVSSMTDEDIELAIIGFSELLANFGVSTKEAVEAIDEVSR